MHRGEYTDLIVRKKSIQLCSRIYSITKSFPKEEIYGITSQIRRASTSIPLNIAEGNSRSSNKEFRHFLTIAYGSCLELETALYISLEQQYLSKEETENTIITIKEIRKILSGLSKSLE